MATVRCDSSLDSWVNPVWDSVMQKYSDNSYYPLYEFEIGSPYGEYSPVQPRYEDSTYSSYMAGVRAEMDYRWYLNHMAKRGGEINRRYFRAGPFWTWFSEPAFHAFISNYREKVVSIAEPDNYWEPMKEERNPYLPSPDNDKGLIPEEVLL